MNGSSIVFTFTIFEEISDAKGLLFAIFFIVYLASVLTSVALMAVIYLDTSLHKPMFIFLFSLILNGLMGSTSVWPKVMSHLASDVHSSSKQACLIQIYFSALYGACTFTILTVMAYDRYVSIFQPLLYHTIMTPQKVMLLLVVANMLPAGLVLVQICLTSGLRLCHYSIHKLFCDNLAVSNLSCGKTAYAFVSNLYGLVLICFFVVLPISLVLMSYLKIILLISKLSAEARGKAFATCTPHLIIFLNFSLSSLFYVIYNRVDHNNTPLGGHVLLSVLYVVVPPLLHPIIYGINNQEIRRSLSKITRIVFPHQLKP